MQQLDRNLARELSLTPLMMLSITRVLPCDKIARMLVLSWPYGARRGRQCWCLYCYRRCCRCWAPVFVAASWHAPTSQLANQLLVAPWASAPAAALQPTHPTSPRCPGPRSTRPQALVQGGARGAAAQADAQGAAAARPAAAAPAAARQAAAPAGAGAGAKATGAGAAACAAGPGAAACTVRASPADHAAAAAPAAAAPAATPPVEK
jgi:hypothetical protein